tara:strand:- start:340 stop:969 length:630 start_codon:yes stop_codon:yes gene_type:complete
MGLADIIKSLRGVGSNVANEGASALLPDWYKEGVVPGLEKFGGSLSGPTMLGDSPRGDTMIRDQNEREEISDERFAKTGLRNPTISQRLGFQEDQFVSQNVQRNYDTEYDHTMKMPSAVQRQDGMGLNNIANRHGSFPLLKQPHGTNRVLDGGAPVEVREQSVTIEDLLPALGFGDKRQGTTYDGSIEGGGWFTPEEYQRNYSRFGRGA